MQGKKDYPEMLGETLREAAVLVLVFGFLDAFLQREELVAQGLTAWLIVGWVLFISTALWLLGAILERERREVK